MNYDENHFFNLTGNHLVLLEGTLHYQLSNIFDVFTVQNPISFEEGQVNLLENLSDDFALTLLERKRVTKQLLKENWKQQLDKIIALLEEYVDCVSSSASSEN
jgi:spore coat polysaccharide biosynthesis protein SpsF (cytidylyltransferase family)